MLIHKRIPVRYFLKKVWFELLCVLAIGLIIFYSTRSAQHLIPDLPIAIPAFLGTAISVILSFKLNQSYDRWWEARKIWGAIVNESRSFVLQLQSFTAAGHGAAIRRTALRHCGWCYCLGQSLRGQPPLEGMEPFLSPEDLKALEAFTNKPLGILQLTTQEVAALKNAGALDVFSQVQINTTLVSFSNAMGMAERIKSTVFPVTYRIFLHLFIYIFVITLSISLQGFKAWFEISLLLVISAAFFLLEKAARDLQDPFSNLPTDTAVTAIARTIEINIRQLLAEPEVPPALPPDRFFLR